MKTKITIDCDSVEELQLILHDIKYEIRKQADITKTEYGNAFPKPINITNKNYDLSIK